MEILRGIEAARFQGVVLTIGNFDGVHRGHRALLEKGLELSRRAGTALVAMTFEPHPAAILTPDRVPPRLTPLDEKLRLLEAAGAGTVVVVESRQHFFEKSAEAFLRDVVLDRFEPRALVEGENFRFGAHRRGDNAMLRRAGSEHGFELHIVPPVRVALGGHPDTVISSSLVRHLLSSGNVESAAQCLGRPYALLGSIQRGAGRGRTLGFPTANLAATDQLIPAEGVYAGTARAADDREEGRLFPAAISIGRTPTFAEDNLLIEAYLLDFEGDLYGQHMRFEFLNWLRGQQRFASADELRQQIHRDVDRVREAWHA